VTDIKGEKQQKWNDSVLRHKNHIQERKRKLRLIKHASFPRMCYEGDISVRVKRTQRHFHQRRRGQNQGVARKGTFDADFRITFYST